LFRCCLRRAEPDHAERRIAATGPDFLVQQIRQAVTLLAAPAEDPRFRELLSLMNEPIAAPAPPSAVAAPPPQAPAPGAGLAAEVADLKAQIAALTTRLAGQPARPPSAGGQP
jgi:hypothetical protein